MGKGSSRRNENTKKFENNYDEIKWDIKLMEEKNETMASNGTKQKVPNRKNK